MNYALNFTVYVFHNFIAHFSTYINNERKKNFRKHLFPVYTLLPNDAHLFHVKNDFFMLFIIKS